MLNISTSHKELEGVQKSISPASALEALRNARCAGLIVEPESGRILAANGPASSYLGFDADEPPPGFEAGDPGLARLRDIAKGVEPCLAAARPLPLRGAAGTLTVDCHVALVIEPGHRPAVLITMPAITGHEVGVDQAGPVVDDAAILRKIAQRIREDSATLAEERGGTAMSVPSLRQDATATAIAPELFDERDERSVPAEQAAAGVTSAENDKVLMSAPTLETPERQAAAPAATSRYEAAPIVPGADLARLAHELRTPLSAIAAAAEVMRDERLGPLANDRYKGYASDIFDGAKHALDVIERLLVTGGRGAKEVEPSGFSASDLNAIAQSCASSMLPIAEKAGMSLDCRTTPDLPLIMADATQLRQIILNLLTNSVKFSAPGAAVSLKTWGDKKCVSLSVTDTGKGMTKREIKEALSAIRPRAVSADGKGGLGIGLPLVRSLVEGNKGTLDIKSESGQGTTITIQFPRRRVIAV